MVNLLDVNSIDQLAHVKGPICAHLNIRSICPKIDIIRHDLFDGYIDVLCLTETWFKCEIPDSFVDIPGYTVVGLHRAVEVNSRTKSGGGVCIFIKKEYNFSEIHSAWHSTPDIEALSIILKLLRQRDIFVVVYYRPPSGNAALFFELLATIIGDNCDVGTNLDLLLTGDTNIDTGTETADKELFDDFLRLYDLEQIIGVPTRISKHKSSVLDHISVRGNYFGQYATIDTNLSDHLMVLLVKKDNPKLVKSFVWIM